VLGPLLVDALDVPVLSQLFGRRRGWLLFSQLLLIVSIVLLAFSDPAVMHWYIVFGAALFVATASATQDIVIDAFRIESLPESEQAAGMAAYVAAYRIGMLASTARAPLLVSGFEGLGLGKGAAWTAGYLAKKGSEFPRLDTEVLLAHVLGCRRIELYTRYEEPAWDEVRTRAIAFWSPAS